MDVYNLHTKEKEEGVSSPLSVALGNFDGVHKGHVSLIEKTVAYAKEHGIASAVWTFADDANALPNKPTANAITTTEEKLALFAELGVDYVLLERFESVRNLSPEEFVAEHLKKACRAVCAVCGFNFRFGAGGLGNCDTLAELMAPADCIVLPPFYMHGKPVSSTAIRLLIEAGEMEAAAQYLGRPFFIDFPVVHGKQLGRTIGIPTINQHFPKGHVIPKRGIYACTVDIGGDIFLGVANVGSRPTVAGDSDEINCETHIIHYNGWLYGKNIKVSFRKRLRDEKKFESLDALKVQIASDIEVALDWFAKQ